MRFDTKPPELGIAHAQKKSGPFDYSSNKLPRPRRMSPEEMAEARMRSRTRSAYGLDTQFSV